MGQFAGRVVWVTGAASGIGRATADLFVAEGASVLYLDRNTAGLVADGKTRVLPLDVSDEAGWDRVVAEARTLGRLDVAVHAAGISLVGDVIEMPLAEWRQLLAVNLDGVFLGTRSALRLMREYKTPGSIINVSSASGLRASPGGSAYCASKAAVCMFTRASARECLRDNVPVRVNTVCPGAVKTPIWRTVPFFRELIEQHGSEEAAFAAFAGPNGRLGEPEEIARAILYLASDDARLVTGTDLVIDDGYSAGV